MEHQSKRSSVRVNCTCKRRLLKRSPSSMGRLWETRQSAHMPGAYVWEKVQGRLSLHIGASLGDLWRYVCLPGIREMAERGSGNGLFF